MQARLRAILGTLGYADSALWFVGSVAEARETIDRQRFTMALIDIRLPDGSGIDLIRLLHERDPALPKLIISTLSTEYTIVAALKAGASGYLLKERDDVEIALSVRSALRGGAPIDPFIARHILGLIGSGEVRAPAPPVDPARAAATFRLSPREVDILVFVSKGLTNREISELLSLSRLTVECHIKNIYRKLAVNSRTEAVFEARTHGLLP